MNKKFEANPELIMELDRSVQVLAEARNEELDKVVLAETWEQMISNTPSDISARYWLGQFLEPLSRKELKSIIDGFLLNMINEEQAKKMVRFLMIRFPQYYSKDVGQGMPGGMDQPGLASKDLKLDQPPGEPVLKK